MYQDLDTLVNEADRGNISSILILCEILLDNYADLRLKQTVVACNATLLKLHWLLLQKKFPVIGRDNNIKEIFNSLQQSPTLAEIQKLLKSVILSLQNQSSEIAQQYLHILPTVYNKFGSLIPQIFCKYLKDYCDAGSIRKSVVSYNREPSFRSYTELIKGLLSHRGQFNETDRAKRYLISLFSKWKEIDNSIDRDIIIEKCEALSKRIGLTDQYRFSKTQYQAESGSKQDMANLGTMYEHGMGVSKNEEKAIQLYQQAIAHGYEPAKSLLDSLRDKQRVRAENNLQMQKLALAEKEVQERIRLEEENLEYRREQLEEEKRHNNELEKIEQQKAEEAAKQAEIEKEEKTIRVIFYYTLLTNRGYTVNGEKNEDIPITTYNALIAGGEPSICNYILGRLDNVFSGERIIQAIMSEL